MTSRPVCEGHSLTVAFRCDERTCAIQEKGVYGRTRACTDRAEGEVDVRARVHRRCGARASVPQPPHDFSYTIWILCDPSRNVLTQARGHVERATSRGARTRAHSERVAYLTLAATEEMEEETEDEELEEEMASLLRLLRLDAAVPMLTCRGRQHRLGGSSQRPVLDKPGTGWPRMEAAQRTTTNAERTTD